MPRSGLFITSSSGFPLHASAALAAIVSVTKGIKRPRWGDSKATIPYLFALVIMVLTSLPDIDLEGHHRQKAAAIERYGPIPRVVYSRGPRFFTARGRPGKASGTSIVPLCTRCWPDESWQAHSLSSGHPYCLRRCCCPRVAAPSLFGPQSRDLVSEEKIHFSFHPASRDFFSFQTHDKGHTIWKFIHFRQLDFKTFGAADESFRCLAETKPNLA
jgi:hypothetical protein